MKKYIFSFMIILALLSIFVPVQVNAEDSSPGGHPELSLGAGSVFDFVKKVASFGQKNEYKNHGKRSGHLSMKPTPPLSDDYISYLVDEHIGAFKKIYRDDLRSMDYTLPDDERQEKDFSRIEDELSLYGTTEFVAGAEEQYEKACINCGSSYMDVALKWGIMMDVIENTSESIVVRSAELKDFMKYGSFVEVTLSKEDNKWKLADIEYSPFSEEGHLDLLKDEAEAIVLEDESRNNAEYIETTSREITDPYGYPYRTKVHRFSVNDGEYKLDVVASNGEQSEVFD